MVMDAQYVEVIEALDEGFRADSWVMIFLVAAKLSFFRYFCSALRVVFLSHKHREVSLSPRYPKLALSFRDLD